MRSEFEESLGQTDGFHDGYVTWNELSNQYESSVEDFLDIAEWMNGAFTIYQKTQSKVDDLEHENTLLRNRVSSLESKLRVYPKYVKLLKDRNDEQQNKLDEYDLRIKRLIESEENIARGCEEWRSACFKLWKKEDACQKLLSELKESKAELVECDLYDKGVGRILYSVINDLEQALKDGEE